MTTAAEDMIATISLREWLDLKAARDLLLAACQVSEREYDEENTHADAWCPDCVLGAIPIKTPRFCAHHLRIRAIALAEKT